jgi:predicted nucleotidyltransferase
MTIKEQISDLLKQAQIEKNQPEQIRLYQSLAEEYHKEKDYINATAIYNFALALCEQEKDKETISNINKTLAKIEIEFLLQIAESDKSTNIEKSEAVIASLLSRNQKNRSDIKDIRSESRTALGQCQVASQAPHRNQTDSGTLAESQRATSTVTIQQIHKIISQKLRDFVKSLIVESKLDLARIGLVLPDNFHYAIICFGSLARDEATPYSDLEFGILIDDESDNKDYSLEQKEQRKERAKEYFRNLTKLLNIKIINLGETTITIQDIEELRGLPSPTKNGFSFDGNNKGSCKTPLGNMHHIERGIAEIESDTELSEE